MENKSIPVLADVSSFRDYRLKKKQSSGWDVWIHAYVGTYIRYINMKMYTICIRVYIYIYLYIITYISFLIRIATEIFITLGWACDSLPLQPNAGHRTAVDMTAKSINQSTNQWINLTQSMNLTKEGCKGSNLGWATRRTG